ncbi:MAG TPA: hypothetical protein PKM64_04125 [Thermoanaerobaculia bacterium]|nr:hypothetical protein [Thermoanaerobaculia bacterium]
MPTEKTKRRAGRGSKSSMVARVKAELPGLAGELDRIGDVLEMLERDLRAAAKQAPAVAFHEDGEPMTEEDWLADEIAGFTSPLVDVREAAVSLREALASDTREAAVAFVVADGGRAARPA